MKKLKPYIIIVLAVITLILNVYRTKTVTYEFRNETLLIEHYNKHGEEVGATSVEDYLKRANEVIQDKDVLHKNEKEDGDDVYYLEETNELVIVSTDGYIRTYFMPDDGKDFYDKQ